MPQRLLAPRNAHSFKNTTSLTRLRSARVLKTGVHITLSYPFRPPTHPSASLRDRINIASNLAHTHAVPMRRDPSRADRERRIIYAAHSIGNSVSSALFLFASCRLVAASLASARLRAHNHTCTQIYLYKNPGRRFN